MPTPAALCKLFKASKCESLSIEVDKFIDEHLSNADSSIELGKSHVFQLLTALKREARAGRLDNVESTMVCITRLMLCNSNFSVFSNNQCGKAFVIAIHNLEKAKTDNKNLIYAGISRILELLAEILIPQELTDMEAMKNMAQDISEGLLQTLFRFLVDEETFDDVRRECSNLLAVLHDGSCGKLVSRMSVAAYFEEVKALVQGFHRIRDYSIQADLMEVLFRVQRPKSSKITEDQLKELTAVEPVAGFIQRIGQLNPQNFQTETRELILWLRDSASKSGLRDLPSIHVIHADQIRVYLNDKEEIEIGTPAFVDASQHGIVAQIHGATEEINRTITIPMKELVRVVVVEAVRSVRVVVRAVKVAEAIAVLIGQDTESSMVDLRFILHTIDDFRALVAIIEKHKLPTAAFEAVLTSEGNVALQGSAKLETGSVAAMEGSGFLVLSQTSEDAGRKVKSSEVVSRRLRAPAPENSSLQESSLLLDDVEAAGATTSSANNEQQSSQSHEAIPAIQLSDKQAELKATPSATVAAPPTPQLPKPTEAQKETRKPQEVSPARPAAGNGFVTPKAASHKLSRSSGSGHSLLKSAKSARQRAPAEQRVQRACKTPEPSKASTLSNNKPKQRLDEGSELEMASKAKKSKPVASRQKPTPKSAAEDFEFDCSSTSSKNSSKKEEAEATVRATPAPASAKRSSTAQRKLELPQTVPSVKQQPAADAAADIAALHDKYASASARAGQQKKRGLLASKAAKSLLSKSISRTPRAKSKPKPMMQQSPGAPEHAAAARAVAKTTPKPVKKEPRSEQKSRTNFSFDDGDAGHDVKKTPRRSRSRCKSVSKQQRGDGSVVNKELSARKQSASAGTPVEASPLALGVSDSEAEVCDLNDASEHSIALDGSALLAAARNKAGLSTSVKALNTTSTCVLQKLSTPASTVSHMLSLSSADADEQTPDAQEAVRDIIASAENETPMSAATLHTTESAAVQRASSKRQRETNLSAKKHKQDRQPKRVTEPVLSSDSDTDSCDSTTPHLPWTAAAIRSSRAPEPIQSNTKATASLLTNGLQFELSPSSDLSLTTAGSLDEPIRDSDAALLQTLRQVAEKLLQTRSHKRMNGVKSSAMRFLNEFHSACASSLEEAKSLMSATGVSAETQAEALCKSIAKRLQTIKGVQEQSQQLLLQQTAALREIKRRIRSAEQCVSQAASTGGEHITRLQAQLQSFESSIQKQLQERVKSLTRSAATFDSLTQALRPLLHSDVSQIIS